MMLCNPTLIPPTWHFGSSGSSGAYIFLLSTDCLFVTFLLSPDFAVNTLDALICRFFNTFLGSWWSFGYWNTLLNILPLHSLDTPVTVLKYPCNISTILKCSTIISGSFVWSVQGLLPGIFARVFCFSTVSQATHLSSGESILRTINWYPVKSIFTLEIDR